jgi:hypothetical protein
MKRSWFKRENPLMALVARFTVTVFSTSDWKPSFSSMVATGSRPP